MYVSVSSRSLHSERAGGKGTERHGESKQSATIPPTATMDGGQGGGGDASKAGEANHGGHTQIQKPAVGTRRRDGAGVTTADALLVKRARVSPASPHPDVPLASTPAAAAAAAAAAALTSRKQSGAGAASAMPTTATRSNPSSSTAAVARANALSSVSLTTLLASGNLTTLPLPPLPPPPPPPPPPTHDNTQQSTGAVEARPRAACMHVRAYAGYAALPPALKPWAFDLTRRNMRDMYERTWGWCGRADDASCLPPRRPPNFGPFSS